ncbi:hypothetical protein [Nocardia grenadensis]|uniref:hypothetical protein n=1 Tax=Nocardia grenadensis TaxID=931537 RepID=UPI003D741ECE
MTKVDDAVGLIERHYNVGTWDSVGFQDNQAREALDALAGLSADEFEEAFGQLDFRHSDAYKWDVREQLVHDAGDLKDDPKYRDIITALETDNPKPVIDAKREEETPKFGDYGYERRDEKEHLHWVDLYQPKGASPTLIEMIEDTEFTMQWGFDTLGARNPKAAPDFTNLLDGDQVTTPEGWARLLKEHDEVKQQLEDRQEEATAGLKGVKVNTEDSAVLKSDTFKKLKAIKDELNEHLRFEPDDLTRDGDTLTESSGGPPTSEMQVPVYAKNTDKDSPLHGKFVLTPEAERRYYVRPLEEAAEKWEEEYAKATKEFQKKAEDIDHGDDDRGGDGGRDTGDGDTGNRRNGGNGGNGGGDPDLGGSNDTSNNQNAGQATNANAALEDLDKQFSTILGDSTQDTSATGTDSDGTGLTAASGEDEKSDLKSMVEKYLNEGTGSEGASGVAQAQQPAAAQTTGGGGGMDMSSMIMPAVLASALPNMLNRGNNNNNNDRDDDKRDEDRRDRDQPAPGPGQQSPGVAATPGQPTNAQPAVAPPTDTGTPPVMGAPGAGVDPKLTGPDGKPLTGADGKPLKVPQPVAEALTHQNGNPAINASTAYEGTVAAQTPERPWAIVDGTPNTGDVIAWERHSAVLINNGAGLFYIENGQVVALDQTNLDNAQYGKFQNFLHPSGLDAASATPAAPESPGLPEPKVTQSQPPAPPAVQAPKEPQAT